MSNIYQKGLCIWDRSEPVVYQQTAAHCKGFYTFMFHFEDGIFKRIFLNEYVDVFVYISLTFVLIGQAMALCLTGDRPLPEPMMIKLHDIIWRHWTTMRQASRAWLCKCWEYLATSFKCVHKLNISSIWRADYGQVSLWQGGYGSILFNTISYFVHIYVVTTINVVNCKYHTEGCWIELIIGNSFKLKSREIPYAYDPFISHKITWKFQIKFGNETSVLDLRDCMRFEFKLSFWSDIMYRNRLRLQCNGKRDIFRWVYSR